MMIDHWLTILGVPCTICSDRQPQFTGTWLKAMCSLMGIRHAKSVAHLAQLKWLEGSRMRSCAGSTSPRCAAACLRRFGLLLRPITTPPHRLLFSLNRLSSAGDSSVGEFFARQETTAWETRQQP